MYHPYVVIIVHPSAPPNPPALYVVDSRCIYRPVVLVVKRDVLQDMVQACCVGAYGQ